MSAFRGDCVAKLFSCPDREIIDSRTNKSASLISKHGRAGFDYCAFAMQQRVVQHNRGHSGRRAHEPSACFMSARPNYDFALMYHLQKRGTPIRRGTTVARYL